jgi:hypothetical protein
MRIATIEIISDTGRLATKAKNAKHLNISPINLLKKVLLLCNM